MICTRSPNRGKTSYLRYARLRRRMLASRKFIWDFRYSTIWTAELRFTRVIMGLPEHELILYVSTCLNSTQQMLIGFMAQRLVTTDILIHPRLPKTNDRTPLGGRVGGLCGVAEARKDLVTVTKVMCKDQYVSSSEICYV